jgi:hypothetical protein
MKNTTKGLLFQLPAMILLVLTTIGVFYAKFSGIEIQGKPISWASPIITLLIVASFFVGMYFQRKSDNPYY